MPRHGSCELVRILFFTFIGFVTSSSLLAQEQWGFPEYSACNLIPVSPGQILEREHIPPPPKTSIMNDAERRVAEALETPHDWNFDQVTIAQLAAVLNKHVPCRVDKDSLALVGLASDYVLGTLHAEQLSTRNMLHHLLAVADLSWIIEDGKLVLTTGEAAEDNPRLTVLPVMDVVGTPGMGEAGYDYDTYTELITSVVGPDTWDVGTGPGSISVFSGTFVFRQTWGNAKQIEMLLETMRRVKRNETAPNKVTVPWYGFHFDAGSEPPLFQPVTLNVQSVTLTKLIKRLNGQTKVGIRLDNRGFDDDRCKESCKVDFSANKDPLWQALRRAVQPHDLTVIYDHPFLVITTEQLACEHMLTRIYPVHDLVTASCRGGASSCWGGGSVGDYFALQDVILNEIAPESWGVAGGRGVLMEMFFPTSLVINQSLENHQRIEHLLARLRKAREIERNLLEPSTTRYVRIYWLAERVPVDETIELLRRLMPETEDSCGDKASTYLKPFGHGILVCHTREAHRRVEDVMRSLDLRPPLDTPGGMGGFGASEFRDENAGGMEGFDGPGPAQASPQER
ncbi:MAG: hypothetical protein ACQESR_01675 [Planctomycetota bacterium]